jgi:hypothetical protein
MIELLAHIATQFQIARGSTFERRQLATEATGGAPRTEAPDVSERAAPRSNRACLG